MRALSSNLQWEGYSQSRHKLMLYLHSTYGPIWLALTPQNEDARRVLDATLYQLTEQLQIGQTLLGCYL
ncbi:hypothetical protein Hypma_014743 [Hypsizygus marmoreus]|uniref:Uncharacterized protein n=1 Tax=Hypsizygus marmoreus TaxID=39966 RepID=A0A369JIQ4_HYPMA|nr:hypothetical protein Hypma_014743 [Hypsizygus marmoreus]